MRRDPLAASSASVVALFQYLSACLPPPPCNLHKKQSCEARWTSTSGAQVEVPAKVFGANDEDPDLSALSTARKTNLGLAHLNKLPATMSRGADPLTTDVKSRRGIHTTPMDFVRVLSILI